MTGRMSNPGAAIYVRISDDKVGAGLGVARQREDCERLADGLGVEVVNVFVDNDVSAYSGKPRPEYERLLQMIKAGRFSVVLAWHGDRLHRSPRELEDYIEAVQLHGVDTHFVTAGELRLDTPTGRMIARQVGVMARYESEHRAERISRKHLQAAKQGKWRGGTVRVFGYQTDAINLHPVEADLIRRAYRDVLGGASLGSVIRAWNEAGVTSTTGKPWQYATLRQVLLRPRNYGASVYRGEVVGTGQWEPIVSEALFRSVEAVLRNPARRRSNTNKGRWLLAGLALCGVCAENNIESTVRSATSRTLATATRKGRAWHIYRCRSQVHLARRADRCDAVVEEHVLERLSRRDARGVFAVREDTVGQQLDDQARALRSRMDEAIELWRSGVLTVPQLKESHSRMKAELASLESRMIRVPSSDLVLQVSGAAEPREEWNGLSWAQKRLVIDALMTVTIHRVPPTEQRRFHAELIEVNWRS